MCERLLFGRICPDIHKAKKKYHTSKAPLKFRSPCNPPGTKHKWNPQPWSSRAEEIRISFAGPHYRVSKCMSLRDPRWYVEVNNVDSCIDCLNSAFGRQVCYSCQINALFRRNSRPSTRVANFQMRCVAEKCYALPPFLPPAKAGCQWCVYRRSLSTGVILSSKSIHQ
jgi:hypothetical protein